MYKKYIKRIMDIILAIIFIIITSPILLVAVIAIKIDDSGKVIFKQKRIGKDGKAFYIYKLRTMSIDKKDGVNKVTKVGKILRNTSIDELPQLFNILKGEMSFIGPRPWIEKYNKYFNERDRRRTEVLPGLSGKAQVTGRNNISVLDKIEADIWYVENISFKNDLKIIFDTLLTVFRRTGSSITEMGIDEELQVLKNRNEGKIKIDVEDTRDRKIG